MALARRTKSKKQLVDSSPAPWLGSSGSFDKDKSFIGSSPSSQQSPLRDLMRDEEIRLNSSSSSLKKNKTTIYGFSPTSNASTWFPATQSSSETVLSLKEIQELEEKEKLRIEEEKDLVALVNAFEQQQLKEMKALAKKPKKPKKNNKNNNNANNNNNNDQQSFSPSSTSKQNKQQRRPPRTPIGSNNNNNKSAEKARSRIVVA